ncbi:MAG: hypothetical protein AAF624_17955 [Bacteroidota bacterium]
MGQQQLLLLVLSIVIVGLSVVNGIEAFGENRKKFLQDQTIALMMDMVTKAQAWKMTHTALGGGDNGDPDDFSALSLSNLGLTTEGLHERDTEAETGSQGMGGSYLMRTDFACLKIGPTITGVRVIALNLDCDLASAWMQIVVRGTSLEDLSFRFNEDNYITNGQ